MTAAPTRPSSGTEPLPCPFCGSKAVDRREIDGFPMIYCNGDDCFGPQTTAKSFDDALVQWNTRAPPASAARVPKVRTSHHRNKEEAARLQELVAKRCAAPLSAGVAQCSIGCGEPVAWRYKCEDGQFVYMAKRLTDEQKARGYYTGEEGEDEVDDDSAVIGPFQWSDETPLSAAPPSPGAGDIILNEILKHVQAPNRPASERLDRIEEICVAALSVPSTQSSPPVQSAPLASRERLPSSDAAGAGGETMAPAHRNPAPERGK